MKPCTLKWVVNLFSFSTTMNWRYEHLLIESVRMLLQSKLRGAYRVTKVLASVFKSLQAVPCATPYGETIYIDLRVTSSYRIFAEVMWEEDEQKQVQRLVKAGDIVFDIGAHLGVYTVLLSHLVGPTGRVIAFEPNLRVLPALERTVKERKNVTLLPIALSSFSGEQVLYVPGDDSMASLADWTAGKHGEITRSVCETFTLDELARQGKIPEPDFIKCDVEGAELLVFQGGKEVLDRDNGPILLFEANANAMRGFNVTAEALLGFIRGLRRARYTTYLVESELEEVRGDRLPEHCNLIAIPEAKMDRLERRNQRIG